MILELSLERAGIKIEIKRCIVDKNKLRLQIGICFSKWQEKLSILLWNGGNHSKRSCCFPNENEQWKSTKFNVNILFEFLHLRPDQI